MGKHKNAAVIIKDVFKKRSLEYKTVSQKLGISPEKFLKTINGKNCLNAAEFLSVCLFLNLKLDDFKGCNL